MKRNSNSDPLRGKVRGERVSAGREGVTSLGEGIDVTGLCGGHHSK